jgi:hypothetical protein
MKRYLPKVVALVVSTVLSFGALETAIRVMNGARLTDFSDLRPLRAEANGLTPARYDEQLGWTVRANYLSPGFNTIDYGIRKNSAGAEQISEGGILAVGDSFTAGSEVGDAESWPALLEQKLGVRVFNAGVGGYGTDQTILNAERLIPILKPKTLLIGILLPDDVQRTGYSEYGRPKPYFARTEAGFELRNSPVPVSGSARPDTPLIKRVLSRSMTFNTLFTRLSPDWWYSDVNGQRYVRTANNPIAVTCHLLERLQSRLTADGIRGIVVAQYGSPTYLGRQARSIEADSVLECARDIGYEVVDEYDSLNTVAARSAVELESYYVVLDRGGAGRIGHMSAKGNGNMASLIFAQLQQPPAPAQAKRQRTPRPPGDGRNRLAGIERQHFSPANAVVTAGEEDGPIDGPPVVRVGTTEKVGEHYAVIPWTTEQPGLHTFSVYVLPREGAGVRLQILDSAANGAIVDYTYETGLFDLFKVGQAADLDFIATPATDGWFRLALSAELVESSGAVIIQLRDATGTNFGAGPDVAVQAPMVERGGTATKYCPPGQCPAP